MTLIRWPTRKSHHTWRWPFNFIHKNKLQNIDFVTHSPLSHNQKTYSALQLVRIFPHHFPLLQKKKQITHTNKNKKIYNVNSITQMLTIHSERIESTRSLFHFITIAQWENEIEMYNIARDLNGLGRHI